MVNHGGSGSSDSVGSGIVPVTQTQTIGASSTGASGVELSIVTGGTPRQVAKYDKLPLVPNIEEDVVR